MKYYAGVDGGGTKTAYALFDENKNILAETRSPGSNHENLEGSFEEAADILIAGLNELCAAGGVRLEQIAYTLMGLAGMDHPWQIELLSEKLRVRGLERFELCNDGFLPLWAGSETGAAIAYNMGTGMCCNASDRSGRLRQLAGLGEFSGDIGGGHQIAITAYRLIYDDVCLGIEKTALTKKYFKEFDIKSTEEFVSSCGMYDDEKTQSRFVMRMLDFYFEAAAEGDGPVLKSIDALAERGARLIAAHANTLDFGDETEAVLCGSIHVKLPSDIYVDLLKEKASSYTDKKLDFKKLGFPPVRGCINRILQKQM